MDRKSLDKYLSIAEEAAVAAGKYLSGYKKDDILVDSEQGKDIKISADRDSEKIIIDILQAKSGFPILSEEKGSIGDTESSPMRWVVDPLDGSLNFLRGIPNCCVSVALCRKDKPELGVIYDFNRDELFSGIAGTGAWLNGSAIAVSKINTESKAVLFTGFPANTDFSPGALSNYIERIRTFKKLRWIGSASLSLAYVAAGRADAYLEKGIMFWDIAAGLAIVSGAGGKYFLDGTDVHDAYNVCATNSSLPGVLSKYGQETRRQ